MDSRGDFSGYLLAGLAVNLQQQVGDPPEFPKVGVLHSPHEPRVGMGGRDSRVLAARIRARPSRVAGPRERFPFA